MNTIPRILRRSAYKISLNLEHMLFRTTGFCGNGNPQMALRAPYWDVDVQVTQLDVILEDTYFILNILVIEY